MHRVVSREEWIAERRNLLPKRKNSPVDVMRWREARRIALGEGRCTL
jgi:hypothetical protein